MRLCLIAVLCFGQIGGEHCVIAQDAHQIFEHLTMDQGLSSDKVEAILQDRDGFYWIATQNGLNRFDGTSFKIYRHNGNDPASLTHNYCTALVEDKAGDIWVATYKGVSRFVKSKGSFQTIYLEHPTRNFEIANRIYNLACDQEGNVWIAGNGLWKYDIQKDSITISPKDNSDQDRILNHSLITRLVYDTLQHGLWLTVGSTFGFYAITPNQFYHKANNPKHWAVMDAADGAELTLDSKDRLWFRDRKTQTLCNFESKTNRITYTGKKIKYGIKHINADDKNRIWLFYWEVGAEIFDPESATTNTDFFTRHHRRSMLSEQANSLFVDRNLNYWIASGNGINIYNQDNQYYKLHQVLVKEGDQLKEPLKINTLAQTSPENIWIGTNMGLFKYDLSAGNYRRIKLQTDIPDITTLCADGEKVWIGVYDQLFCLDTKREKLIRRYQLDPGIFFIRKGDHQDLWVGYWTGGLCRIDLATDSIYHFRKSSTEPNSIRSNNLITGLSDGDLFWIGYNAGNGFSSYSISSGQFTHFHPQQDDLSNSNAGTITVITKSRNNILWLGTHGSGIFQFDPQAGTYTNIQQEQGLNSNYINGIVADSQENLWVSTADGMNYIQAKNQSIRQLDMDLVFPDNDFAANALYGLGDKLYFFCKNEFVEIDPASFRVDASPPQLVISGFMVFDKEVPVAREQREIRLSHRENYFSFSYAAIKTHPSKKVSYAYMLEGFDEDWKLAGHEQRASYTNVPEGKYLFKVKATNDEGQWSEALLRVAISISPPFWRTWWFICLCGIAVTLGIRAVYLARIHQLKKIFSIRARISQDLHDDVGASLSSIHIYSTIAGKEIDDNPIKAKEVVQQINENSRQAMESMSDIVWALQTNPGAGESLEGRIKNYGYDLLSQKSIDCIYRIDSLAEKKLQHPDARKNILLIVKEALNNIAKYSEAKKAEVTIDIEDGDILLQVQDNGRGFDIGELRQGNGLRNMRKRTESIKGKFTIHSSPGGGTHIQCRIPIATISDR